MVCAFTIKSAKNIKYDCHLYAPQCILDKWWYQKTVKVAETYKKTTEFFIKFEPGVCKIVPQPVESKHHFKL